MPGHDSLAFARLVQRLRRQVRGQTELLTAGALYDPAWWEGEASPAGQASRQTVSGVSGRSSDPRHCPLSSFSVSFPPLAQALPRASMPVCRLRPAFEADVAEALIIAADEGLPVFFGTHLPPSVWSGFEDLPGHSAGSGTGDVARSAAQGALLVDAAGSLNGIGRFDTDRGLIEVMPGLGLDELNRAVASQGWWLPIESGVYGGGTVAGAVAANAGAACWAWGTVADRLAGIDLLLPDGTAQLFGPFGAASSISLKSGRAGRLVSDLFGLAAEVQTEIARHWPYGLRAPGGYLIDSFHPRPGRPYTADGSVNLAHLLAGSAGTLGWFSRLHLKLMRRPAVSRWLLAGFGGAADALSAMPALLGFKPTAVVLLAAEDVQRMALSSDASDRALMAAHRRGKGQDQDASGAALLIRFSGDQAADLMSRVRQVERWLVDARPGAVWFSREAVDIGHWPRPAGPGALPVCWQLIDQCVWPAWSSMQALQAALDRCTHSFGQAGLAPALMKRLGVGWRLALPAQPPARLGAWVASVDEALKGTGVRVAWQGRPATGELLVSLLPGPVAGREGWAQLARVLGRAGQTDWSSPFQQAFVRMRRQFDPTGVLAGAFWAGA